ncbi:hypothetical protein [uncultured Rhodoblastus sp.]|uniref:hypothetical protein n=1 Tax=uncultured Rhodoblastus sp. TaxID=543037 RepID=UPI0025D18A01|nr:hypothetical protein [uncultured Rhodoblastus sp.]
MKHFQPMQFARLPASRRALRIAELFSLATEDRSPPASKEGDSGQNPTQVQPRRRTAM